ncbi:helix-turn-helix transcriptional regulator [Streptomyces sp. NRRL F-525]|uniref:helix-turn-helix transcriptional regulator n=1 Tax=Streptomyces sp. NRRL F-525 TaxID=1463861 RepID=UPI00131C8B94|nr:LuxR family transcriptional regulator [Streptomyces sp. NRRL F-525]
MERESQTDRIGLLLSECQSRKGKVVMVAAPVGFGKSDLLIHTADIARAMGIAPLTAVAARAESGYSYGIVRQLLRNAAAGSGTRTRLAVPLIQEEETQRLGEILLDAAEQQPLLICVDDIQYADAASLQCLLYLVRRIGSARILVMLTESEQSRTVHPFFHAELHRERHTDRLRLGPLSPAEVGRVLAERLDTLSAHRLSHEYHAVSGGNPLLVRALLTDFAAQQRPRTGPGAGVPAGEAYGRAVVACLHRSEQTVLQLGRAVAVLGAESTPERLGRLCDLEAAETTALLDILTGAGLLRGTRFRHPAAEAAVLADPEFGDRSRTQLSAAQLLDDAGTDVLTVAQHIVAAGEVGGSWVVPVLREAAEAALHHDKVDLTVAFLEAALRANADSAERLAITAALADAEWRLNPTAASRRIPSLLTAMRRGEMSDLQALGMLRMLVWFGMLDQAAETLHTINAQPQSGMSRGMLKETAAEIRNTYKWLQAVCPPLLPHLDEPGSPCTGSSPVPLSERMQATTTLVSVLREGALSTDVAHAEQILATCRLGDRTLEPAHSALLTLVYADQLEQADHWCRVLQDDATARRVPTWQALFSTVAAEIALRRGEPAVARQSARDALSTLAPHSWGVGIGYPLALLLTATISMGDWEEAQECISRPVPPALFQTIFAAPYLQARGKYHLATNNVHAALRDFLACGDTVDQWGLDTPALVPWRTGAAEALLRLGDRDQASRLVLEQLDLPGGDYDRIRGVSLQQLARLQPPEQRLDALHESVDLLQAAGDHFQLAHALADLSDTQQALGDWHKAQALRLRARQLAERCNAVPLVRSLPPDSSARPAEQGVSQLTEDPLSELTGSERRVALLAVQGHSNRVIAEQLVITVSTVEQHLTRVYRKLGVNRRRELVALLQRLPLSPAPSQVQQLGLPARSAGRKHPRPMRLSCASGTSRHRSG